MMYIGRKRNREKKELHIACDMDGCVASLIHGITQCSERQPLPKWYHNALMHVFKCTILDDSSNDSCHDVRIVLKLFTLRKDLNTDKQLAKKNQTDLSPNMLHEFAKNLSTITDLRSSEILIDNRYHKNQLFGSMHQSDYNQCLQSIDASIPQQAQSRFKHQSQPLTAIGLFGSIGSHFTPRNNCGYNKLDLLLTTAWGMASRKAQELVILDDRLPCKTGRVAKDSLESMVIFIAQYPDSIPNNVTIKFYRLEPRQDFMTTLDNSSNLTGELNSTVVDENERNARLWLTNACTREQELKGSDSTNRKPEDFLDSEKVNGDDLPFWFAHYQQALQHVTNIKGTGEISGMPKPDGQGSLAFWQSQLMPVAKRYHYFIQENDDGYTSDLDIARLGNM